METTFKKEDLLQISPFKELATREPYAGYYDAVVHFVQLGQQMGPSDIIGKLFQKSCYYCSISATWRTILYGFAESVLISHKELWNIQEIAEERIFLHDHFKRFYPEYQSEFDNYDIALLEPAEEWFYAFAMWRNGFVPDDLKPAYFYGMYCCFHRLTDFFDFVDEEFMETLSELEENN